MYERRSGRAKEGEKDRLLPDTRCVQTNANFCLSNFHFAKKPTNVAKHLIIIKKKKEKKKTKEKISSSMIKRDIELFTLSESQQLISKL